MTERKQRRKREDGSGIYERKTGDAAGDLHGAADDIFHVRNALYNIIDSYFVAQISEDAMTALSLVFPLQNLVNAVVIGFAIGINATMAYYLGAQKQQLADKTASLGMLLNICMVWCWQPSVLQLCQPFRDVYKTGRNYRNGGTVLGYCIFICSAKCGSTLF